jgi:signal transduction histidine kinase
MEGNENNAKAFTVDARAILRLGRDSIKDHTTALVELVKNSYDADAKKVEIEIMTRPKPAYVRVADSGTGMTEDDVDNRWLRIGSSEKVVEKVSALNRRKTGEKGIGRISADRLGAVLELRTKANGQVFALRVNWDDFNVKDKELSAIPIETIKSPSIRLPLDENQKEAESGTELIITNLRQEWIESDIANLHRELSMLVSPFQETSDFEVWILTDVTNKYNGKVESEIDQNSLLTLSGSFNGSGEFIYTIKDRDRKSKPKQSSIKWEELNQRLNPKRQSKDIAPPRCGPVSVTLMFFPQKEATLKGGRFSLSELRSYLRENHGIRIYRDNIWVKPYGNPKEAEGDWLDLGGRLASNPAGASRKSFRIAPKQLIGAVFVSRDDNTLLIDSSSREGLIHGDAFNDLRRLVMGCVNLLETRYNQKFTEEKDRLRRGVRPSEEVRALSKELTILKRELRQVAPILAKAAEHNVNLAVDRLSSVVSKIQNSQNSLSELESQATIYRGLATIGIASTVFAHETQTSISGFVGSAYNASRLLKLKTPNIPEALEQIELAKEYADQVAAWGTFALTRIQRDKRKRVKNPINQLIEELIEELKPALHALDINVTQRLRTVEGKFLPMDIEAIVINLITNAYTACQQKSRKREIRIELHPKKESGVAGLEIAVADTGPGVAKQFIDRIWEPLFTTKTNEQGKQVGTGLGLSIIQSIVDELGGIRRITADPELKGARFSIWLPLSTR